MNLKVKFMSKVRDFYPLQKNAYRDVYIQVKGELSHLLDKDQTIVTHKNEQVVFKNYEPFTEWINKINNTQKSNGKDLDVVVQQ